jgi:hypothetical protein
VADETDQYVTAERYTVADEVRHQFVITVFGLVGTVGTLWIMANMADAATWQRLKMRTALRTQWVAHRMVDVTWRGLEFWNTVGLAATAWYDKEKN